MDEQELNARIAEVLGWQVWQDPRPEGKGRWFAESADVIKLVPDYIGMIRSVANNEFRM